MKKIFTLICALVGFAGAANAASVDDLVPLKHSYVLVCDELGARPGQGVLFGDNHFIDLKGGTVATNKGKTNLSQVDALGEEGAPLYVTQEIVDKYGEYGEHNNWLRLKNTQDMIAMKPTAGSKIIFYLQGNNKTGKDARYPKLSKKEDLSDPLNAAPTADFTEYTVSGYRMEFTVPNDWGTDDVLYVGSYNGDMFVSFIIVEALEAEGTPSVKVGPQTYADGLWYREVTCKTVKVGTDNTIATYTTDGSTPNENSPVYTGPIKCYANQTVKFQAYYDWFEGAANSEAICEGADNEGNVNFSFDAPTIDDNGANFTITSPYAEQNGSNFYKLNDGDEVAGNGTTLTESAVVTAYTKITNGAHATFTTKSTTKEIYVLDPIKAEQILTMTGDKVANPEKVAETDPNFIVENGAVNHDKKFFFVRNTGFKVVEEADYQAPAGQEIYLMMNGDIITFQVAEGDSVDVEVTCSKNSCKNINLTDEEVDAEGSKVANDRKCFINVDGKNYSAVDAEGNEAADLKRNPNANIVKFGLAAGTHTFKKYSGTGNILVSSIKITPVETDGINNVNVAENANGAMFNLAGQKVANNYKGLVIMNGKKVVMK